MKTFEKEYNPFNGKPWNRHITNKLYDLEGILLDLNIIDNDENIIIDNVKINHVNYNPYITLNNGEKIVYQRDYVWSLDDEQKLIQSIYNELDCGKIVVYEHSYDEIEKRVKNGEKDLYFKDIIDGKQRLHTLKRFINNEFPDYNGKYFNEFSLYAKRKFMRMLCFQYIIVKNVESDEEIIDIFLNINFSGKPMDKNYLSKIQEFKSKL